MGGGGGERGGGVGDYIFPSLITKVLFLFCTGRKLIIKGCHSVCVCHSCVCVCVCARACPFVSVCMVGGVGGGGFIRV